MNTPPKLRRYTKPPPHKFGKGAIFVGSIADEGIRKRFTDIMTGFVSLEERMASLLAVLLGSTDKIAASYVLRAIKSPTGRIDVMKELLEKAPINRKLGAEYDLIIREFRAISKARNTYAHGKWWTHLVRGGKNKIVLDETDDPNAALHVRREVKEDELEALEARMLNLHLLLRDWPEAELKKRQQAGPQPHLAPNRSSRPRRSAPK